MKHTFDDNFLWGAATSAAQIEGAWNENGRTPSIWDNPPARKIKYGENPSVACDHIHRYKEDIALMKELGLKSYRFSVSWSRVMTESNCVNEKGLQFYSDLVDELKRNGIEPLCTLYHWDMPLWVYKQGGFMSEKTVQYFADYVRTVVEALSDRVRYFMTINEPSVFFSAGYGSGDHAPFEKAFYKAPRLMKNILLCHAKAVETIRKYAKCEVKVGVALAVTAYIPPKEPPDEIEKARKITFSNGLKIFDSNIWADLILQGRTDDKMTERLLGNKVLAQGCPKLDFVGVNVYRPLNYTCSAKYRQVPAAGIPRNALGWELCPSTLYWVLRFFSERYNMPIMVTENGVCLHDAQLSDGAVNDGARVAYLQEVLQGVKRAVEEGVPVIGYQYWSLMDNFEWAEGYDPRFGLIYVDFKTQQRTIKASGYYYKKVIATNGEL